MSKSFKVDLTGQRFGRLTVIEFVPNGKEHSYWKCCCECGKEKIIEDANLKSGTTISCGCWNVEEKTIRKKHGGKGTRLYNIWGKIIDRCENNKHTHYKNYGAKGITICKEWRNNFAEFRDWSLSHGYTDVLSIDRIDVNGNYEPSNCRWADARTQANNRRNTIFVELNGKTVCLSEAARLSGIPHTILDSRYHRGDRGERLFRPVRKPK